MNAAYASPGQRDLDAVLRRVAPCDAADTVLLVDPITSDPSQVNAPLELTVISDRGHDASLVFDENGREPPGRRVTADRELVIHYWRAEDLGKLQRCLGESVSALTSSSARRVAGPSDVEFRFLHLLRTGVVLANPNRADHWRKVMRVAALSEFLVLSWSRSHRYLVEEVRRSKDIDPTLCGWTLRASLELVAGVMLASVGETDPEPIHRLRLLRRHHASLGDASVARLFALLLGSRAEDLHADVHSVLSFAELAIEESRTRLPGAVRTLSRSISEDKA
jgi:hypothetical protein